MWVPSHVGLTDSEMADKSANLVTKTILHPSLTDIDLMTLKPPSKKFKHSMIKLLKLYYITHKMKNVKKIMHPLNYNRYLEKDILTKSIIDYSFLNHGLLIINKDLTLICTKFLVYITI